MGFAMDDMSDVRNYSQRITLTIAPTTYWPYDDDVVALAPLEAPLAMLPGLEPHSFGMKTLQDPQLSVNESYADLHLKVTYDGQSEDVAVGFKFGAEGDTFDCGPANEYRWWSVRVTNGSTLSY
ncbi:hypothetical protein TREMEDRAFT_56123 [Tremella mesenterica DSM 1558]|nr:uncharacterized protein TREMEDRAFT_56123 [Tremella mesenterica DSM 1558]EIW73099.1 hypothetical protein TREMEDRAFT_56123 [Tremella mesenterica DSM 1558]